MIMIEDIQNKVSNNLFELSGHALSRSIERSILLDEIIDAILSGMIIEHYPNDRYGPTCLILGYTRNRRPLHIQCSYPSRPLIKVITLYEPTTDKWEHNLKIRRQ